MICLVIAKKCSLNSTVKIDNNDTQKVMNVVITSFVEVFTPYQKQKGEIYQNSISKCPKNLQLTDTYHNTQHDFGQRTYTASCENLMKFGKQSLISRARIGNIFLKHYSKRVLRIRIDGYTT